MLAGTTPVLAAADVVLLADRLDRLADVLAIARGTRRIAIQTVAIGMGLSLVAMEAIVRLHFAQEDELYHTLADPQHSRASGKSDGRSVQADADRTIAKTIQ